jgi:hypothetical protein
MCGNSLLRKKSSAFGLSYIGIWDGAGISGHFSSIIGEKRVFLNSRLGKLQLDFLQAFFSRERRFFLTGGAALAGFHLGHRETHDLDLFTLEDVVEEGAGVIADLAREMGATVESIQTSPDFRRQILTLGSEAVVIDLVHERVPQVVNNKPLIGIIRIDPPEEILANKLCALLGRAEIRDLVDVRALEISGFSVDSALSAAARKDAGLTPAQLGWVLNQITLGDDLIPPGGVSVEELRSYLARLIARLSHLAFPLSNDE